jgi:hypothetical protein
MEIIPYIAVVLLLLLCLLPKTPISSTDYEVYGDPQDYQKGYKSSIDDYEVYGDPQDYQKGSKNSIDDYEVYGDPQDY